MKSLRPVHANSSPFNIAQIFLDDSTRTGLASQVSSYFTWQRNAALLLFVDTLIDPKRSSYSLLKHVLAINILVSGW